MDKISRIRVQRVDVEFDLPDDAFAIRDRLSTACQRLLLPAMEKLIDAKCGDGRLISVPYLLIDAGTIEDEHWEEALADAILKELEKQLEQLRRGKESEQPGGPAQAMSGPVTGQLYGDRLGHRRRDEAGQEGSRRERNETEGGGAVSGTLERNAGFLLYYLEKGTLPWNCPFNSTGQLKDTLQILLDIAAGAGFLKDIRSLFIRSDHALRRFLYLLPEKQLEPALFHGQWNRRELAKIRGNWVKVFRLAGLPEDVHDVVFLQGLAVLRERNVPAYADPLTLAGALAGEIGSILHRRHDQVSVQLSGIRKKHPQLFPRSSVLPPRNDRWKIPPAAERNAGAAFSDESVYINNAGLVLLHPFLNRLFENTGHTLKDQWSSPDLQHRSIVLMSYLVRGTGEYAEPDLLLNKLLTGVAPDDALPLDIHLSEFEQREADELLEAVIGHWKALKNTGIAALRETFLERPGKIERTGNGWLLRVDQKVADILLNKLPWGFSTIKTPWMKEILNVDWT